MGLSSALSIATSGLRSNGIQQDLIARNIANASTEGYTRKSANLVTQAGGVTVKSVGREVDGLLNRLDRTNTSDLAKAQTVAEGLVTYTSLLGQPDEEISPAAGLGELYNSLVTLSGLPTSYAAQVGVIESANKVASQINSLATTANELSKEVDLNIRYDVSDVNERLERIGQVNMRLMQSGPGSVEAAELQDELDGLLDEVSQYMDIQITTYGDGAVNVYTSGGTELVTGRRVATVTYDATTGTLRAGQIDITPGVDGVRGLTGGSLAGLYELRNTTIPTLRAELDEYATQLIDRFSSIDGSLTANESGLFVDQAALNGSNDASGVASRLIVNPKLDTVKGGNASLLISGLGSKGDKVEGAELVNNMLSVIDERMGGKTLYGENLSLNQYVTMMVAGQQQSRATAERAVESIEVSGATIAASRQNLQGVNIDDELQKLLVVEQSYAANAKVLSTVQSMLDELFAAV